MRWSWGFWRRERALARETLSMMVRHAPRLARSWRELRSWQSPSKGCLLDGLWRGSVCDSDLAGCDSIVRRGIRETVVRVVGGGGGSRRS